MPKRMRTIRRTKVDTSDDGRVKVGDHLSTTNPLRIIVDKVPKDCKKCPMYMYVTNKDYEDTKTNYCLLRSKLIIGQYGAVCVEEPDIYDCPLMIADKQCKDGSSFWVRNKVLYITIRTIVSNLVSAINARLAALNTPKHPVSGIGLGEVLEFPSVNDEDRV